MEFKNILVPVDFSEFSDKAIETAFNLAERFQAKITLAHVIVLFQEDFDEESRFQEYEDFVKKREGRAQQQVQLRHGKAVERKIPVNSVLLRGFAPTDALLEHIEEKEYDLVVMGTHGRTGLKHFVQGSVAEKMVRVAPIPVLTVHRSVQKFDIEKVMVPIDFSNHSRRAADYAAGIARTFKGKIVFFHAIEPEVYPAAYEYNNGPLLDFDPNLDATVLKNLKEFLADAIDENLVEDYVVMKGLAHKEIVAYAGENHIDLLVIATHGLTGLEYILLGSTAEKVTRWAACPVLTIKRID